MQKSSQSQIMEELINLQKEYVKDVTKWNELFIPINEVEDKIREESDLLEAAEEQHDSEVVQYEKEVISHLESRLKELEGNLTSDQANALKQKMDEELSKMVVLHKELGHPVSKDSPALLMRPDVN